jgi:hypothetical protein
VPGHVVRLPCQPAGVKEVSYVGDAFITGDAIADAVLDYGVALANAGHADKIAVPGIGRDGDGEFELLIGPASQLSAAHVEHTGPELEDPGFVSDIRDRIAHQHDRWAPSEQVSALDWDV